MLSRFRYRAVTIAVTLVTAGSFAFVAYANHSWGSYHWARTASSFTLKLGDNVTSAWDSYLSQASSDWSVSSVLDTTVVAGGTNSRNCKPILGRVEVCNNRYGNNGWLGVAQIWANGNHIAQGTVKMNDTYFGTVRYNTPAWKRFVVCQEVGHTFGLDHQDENFTNPNLGTCMDYTNDPSGILYGQLSNEHPNQHDYDELESIYAHIDTGTTVGQTTTRGGAETDGSDPGSWGKEIRRSHDGRGSLYERDFGHGKKVFTFVIWAQ